jgi:hypothetical protein
MAVTNISRCPSRRASVYSTVEVANFRFLRGLRSKNTTMKTNAPILAVLMLCAGVYAPAAAPVITNLAFSGADCQMTVHSDVAITNQILCSTNLSQPGWTLLTNLLVIQSPYSFVDEGAGLTANRFYQVVAQYPASNPPPAGMALIPAFSGWATPSARANSGSCRFMPFMWDGFTWKQTW